ncbi:hypothetical protein [Antrihabitans cavernicola]|uniref:PPE domain-containing protein n=1 Tax=Antrihabitans cavernicola TaxID=2495913 RepID=A0A5A7SFT1_9NOCA|nr:hypothetical protein [Spelaeibacter cavernicola]KAA0024990.1 hypothetical protein FOY51_03500 [Spelaeibacter cavernicola]
MSDPIDILAPGAKAAANTEQWSQSIARQESERGAREAALGRDVDPQYVTSMENFEGLSHAEMYKGAQEMMPGTINEAVGKWGNIGTAITFANARFKQGIETAMAGKWEGVAADAATRSVATFASSCDTFQGSVYAITDRLMEVGQAAQIVKTSVPPPPISNPLQVIAGLPNVAAAEAQKAAEEAAHREAVRIMTTHYQPTYQNAGDNVPRFTAPQGIPSADGGGGVGGSGTGGSASGQGGSGTTGLGPTGTQAHDQQSGDQQAGNTNPAADSQAGNQQGNQQSNQQGDQAGDQSGSQGDSTHAANAADGQSGNQAANAPGTNQNADAGRNPSSTGGANPYGSGGLSGLTGGGAGGLGRGTGGLGSGGLSGAGAKGSLTPSGLPGSATGPEGKPGAGGVAAGRPGAPGAGGMHPGGRKGKGEDDDEHKIPSYLVNVDNGNELIGKMPPAAPPVLGAYEPE